MRIISGKNKGRQLIAPSKLPVRPTTDFAKESLFNILNNHYYFENISVLDLFAGTGNISYEFASRGAENVTCVDENKHCIEYVNKISKDLSFNIKAYRGDVFTFLEKTQQKWDVIFADPPYDLDKELYLTIADQVFQRNLLSQEGMLIIEHSTAIDLSQCVNFSYLKKYGSSVFSFFEIDLEDE